MSDYGRFIKEAKALGAECVGKIGDFDGKFYDAWHINGLGFILARNSVGRIGLYTFQGRDGAPVENDIQWLRDIAEIGSYRVTTFARSE